MVNYEDPNYNISIPVFSIHGNHDDPAGVRNKLSWKHVYKKKYSLRSSLFHFLSGKQESRKGTGTCIHATSPWLSLSPAKRKWKRLLCRLEKNTVHVPTWLIFY